MKTASGVIRAAWAIAASAAFAAGPSAANASEPLRVDFANRLSLGYDSFIDRFTILDDDTAVAAHDVYASLGNTLSFAKGPSRLSIGNLLRYGSRMVDEAVDIDAGLNPAATWRLDLRGGIRYKHFLERSDTLVNDYLQGNASVRVRRRFSERFRAGARARLELVDFERRTLYDCDYVYRDAGLEIEAGSDYANMIFLSGRAGVRETSDTLLAPGFNRYIGELETRGTAGDLSVHVGLFADRREYRESARSDRWNVNSNFEAAMEGSDGRTVSVRAETELLSYDRPDAAYFNSQFLRGGLRVRFPAGSAAAGFIEPRYGQMLCNDFAEERYREVSVILGIDAFGNERYWLTASYEPGYRHYTATENDLYSDFAVNRVSVMGSLAFARDFSVNLFLNHEPETHTRREDNFSITLLSIDLTWRF